jgi:hypothetical protein
VVINKLSTAYTHGILDYFALILFSYIANPLVLFIILPMQTTIKFPSGNTLVLNTMAVVLLYSIAYDAVIVDQNGQLCLPF